MDVNGKQVVVLGLGISGMEAAKLLQDKGAEVTVRDNAAGDAKVSAEFAAASVVLPVHRQRRA